MCLCLYECGRVSVVLCVVVWIVVGRCGGVGKSVWVWYDDLPSIKNVCVMREGEGVLMCRRRRGCVMYLQ